MSVILDLSAVLAFAVGVAHSILGERYILMRFRPDHLPRLLGGTDFTERTLRFAWHLTTVAWFGFGAILLLLAHGALSAATVSGVIAATFLISALLTLIVSRARHLAWLIFTAIGLTALYAAVR